jgi:hypothetical protein
MKIRGHVLIATAAAVGLGLLSAISVLADGIGPWPKG